MEVMANSVDIHDTSLPKTENILQEKATEINISLQIKRNCLLALNNISKITDNLYLSGAMSLSPSVLEALDIRYVINVAPELPDTPLPSNVIKYTRIPVYDNLSSNLLEYFESCADAIHEEASNNRNVLVHCVAGVSRSASICIAYVMKYNKFNLLQAYNYVKERRPIVRPNCSFINQLISFENTLYSSNSISLVFNDHLKMMIPDIYAKDYKSHHDIRKERNSSVKG
ncbi:dual specificity protein phosphatase 18 [Agrilus planipennis]|uniref:Dual specificity protein phosphatase 18 n=1 Tax=Agrilus planipennis TaxID=224129 RepID=A0A1W4W6A2_AGRPL|nr:dual specificity protein phosphatase 18 [Agrilus planipennis]